MLEMAILGALKEKPMYGYELKKRLSFLLGHLWKISYGSLYPALKRLEGKDAVERAYTVKAKTRNRNVYRITAEGEEMFQRLLVDTRKKSEITDADKFSIRLAFFQYMEPEMRLWLLERRRHYLEERLTEMSGTVKGRDRDSDSYRQGLFRHRQDLLKSDIVWLQEMIDTERQHIQEGGAGAGAPAPEDKGGEKLVINEGSIENMTPMQA